MKVQLKWFFNNFKVPEVYKNLRSKQTNYEVIT